MPLVALWAFGPDDTDEVAVDSVTSDPGGATDASFIGDAGSRGGRAFFDGHGDYAEVAPDPGFQLDRGTIEIVFRQAAHVGTSPDALISRDSEGFDDGGHFHLAVTAQGAVTVRHQFLESGQGRNLNLSTPEHFFAPGDEVRVTYSWDLGGAGGTFTVANLTSGAEYSAPVPDTVTFDQGHTNEPFLFGAGQTRSGDNVADNLNQFFNGSIDYVSLSDSVDAPGLPAFGGDGIVQGTGGDDVIDLAYTGDPQGDRIDAGDALVPGAGRDDDIVEAGAGNDHVRAGRGDDIVFGERGNDILEGEEGDDQLYGDAGNDDLRGGDGNDLLSTGAGRDSARGGRGNDILIGGAGLDRAFGEDDRDTFSGFGAGDLVDGGEGGDDFDILNLSGQGRFTLRPDGPSPENGIVDFASGGSLHFRNIEKIVPCFTPGTLIATPTGERAVEDLAPGDQIVTRDNGIQTIRWTGRRALDWAEMSAAPHLRPILILRGALGHGLPERDMLVSPNHRLLVASDRTALYFAESEVLVAAKHLVNNRGIQEVQALGTTYIHFMFDQHQVVLSDGTWTESFQPGDFTLGAMGNAQRSEILEVFPDLARPEGIAAYQPARRSLRRHEARLLVD